LARIKVAIFNRQKFEKIAVQIPKNLGWAIAFFSGILMGLTTAPVNAWLLAWVALVPLWVLVVSYEQPKQEVKRQKVFFLPSSFFLLPLFWGIGYHGLALSWIMGIHPMTWLGVPWWPSLAIALLLGLHHSLGSRISNCLGMAICDLWSHFS
jgi:apolipoprotein N-acyltransferase